MEPPIEDEREIFSTKKGKGKGRERGNRGDYSVLKFGLEATVPQARAVILQFKSVGREIGTHVYVAGVERRFK